MLCIEVTMNGQGQTLIIAAKNYSLEELEIIDSDAGDEFTIRFIEMDQEALDSLPEFDGF